MLPRDDDQERITSDQETINIESKKIQLKQLIKLINSQAEIGVKSWLEKNIQSKKQVYGNTNTENKNQINRDFLFFCFFLLSHCLHRQTFSLYYSKQF